MMPATMRHRVAGALVALVMVALILATNARPAHAATAMCDASNITSSSVHAVTQLASNTCGLVRARATLTDPDGADMTVYGPVHSISSVVEASPGLSLDTWAGAASPVGDLEGVQYWPVYHGFTMATETVTYRVSVP